MAVADEATAPVSGSRRVNSISTLPFSMHLSYGK